MLNRFSSPRWLPLLALLACTLGFATPASAADGPAGRIGRIAWLSDNGNVQIDNPASGESFSAPLNQPLTSGDVLTTEAGTRAEIQIGSITVRLDGGSRLTLDRIDDDQVALFLNEGRAITRLSSPDTLRDFSLETRNGRFSARETGVFRFDSGESYASATVYAGTLHMQTDDGETDLRSGERAIFNGPPPVRYRLASAFNDSFSQWSAARDQRSSAPTYSRYVSPEMTGAQDLDAHGNWSETPEYGAVWYPRTVAADWAPYRSGRWVWVAPWGWNWVGNEPWGFAPFHYGRWVHHHGRWGWVPGVRIARPVYAPAMVAWVGNANFGISISIGSAPRVGWFPLGPREVYVPSYRCGTNYVRNVNVTHVTNITNITHIVNKPQDFVRNTRYMHRDAPNAVTVVPADVVTHRRPVAPANIAYREHRGLRDQPVHAGAPLSAPVREVGESKVSKESRGDEGRDERRRFSNERERERPQATPVERRNQGFEARSPADSRNPVAQSNGTTGATRQIERPNNTVRPDQREGVNRDGSRPVPAGVSAPAPRATETAPRRNERPSPDVASPSEPMIRERASRRDEAAMPRPQRETRSEATAPPTVIAAQRTELPPVEAVRQMPQTRPQIQPQSDPIESRRPERMPERVVQERPQRREEAVQQAPVVAVQRMERPAPPPRPEPAAIPQPRESRSEAVQQRPPAPVSAPAHEARRESPREMPREMQRSPEPRAEIRQESRQEARAQRQEAPRQAEPRPEPRQETRGPRPDDQRHKRDDGDRR